jgi:hypothetical protein
MDERTLKSLRQLLIEDTERQVDAFDDSNLTISETLYAQLRAFHARSDDLGVIYVDVSEREALLDMASLEEAGLVQRSAASTHADGTHGSFLEIPYTLTLKARRILRTPEKYLPKRPAVS